MGAAVAVEVAAAQARERLADFVGVMVAALPHVRQRENALVYVRGLIEQGGRKSLQPTLFRLEETPARYESVQQFLADSPWDPGLLVRAGAERVAPELGVLAWVVDDTGIAKQGRHSPGVKRQYSGTLGKIGNCQITVSVHAVGTRGTLPLGWALYLPEEWCEDELRRARAKIPAAVAFATKPRLADGLIEQAAGWQVPLAPILADSAYGDNSAFRRRLHARELEYGSPPRPRSVSMGRRRPSRCRNEGAVSGGVGRSPDPTGSQSRCARSRSGCQSGPGRRFPVAPLRTASRSRAASPSSASSRPIRSATTTCRRARSG